MENNYSVDWNAADYFRSRLDSNILAIREKFVFCQVSGLEGLEDMLRMMQDSANFFAVSDVSDGFADMSPAAISRRVKTVFVAMRHQESNMEARALCMDTMRELWRQMMSALKRDKTRFENEGVYIDDRIQFSEIDSYFFSGCACAFFQVAFDIDLDLCYNEAEWTD